MKKKGFTLIELMIVVAIIGILASVAIPSFLKFIRQSKTSEAPLNLRSIVNGSVAWWNEDHAAPNGNPMRKHFPWNGSPTTIPPTTSQVTAITPSQLPCGSMSVGSMYPKNTAIWISEPWASLKFSITKAHYYQYLYQQDNATSYGNIQAGVFAVGDLDCDSTYGFFQSNLNIGTTDNEVLVSELLKGSRVLGNPPDYSGDSLE